MQPSRITKIGRWLVPVLLIAILAVPVSAAIGTNGPKSAPAAAPERPGRRFNLDPGAEPTRRLLVHRVLSDA